MAKISVIIPCYNEEKTIKKVVSDFKRELPDAEIIVIDNNSTDNSVKLAQEAGAKVMFERKQGKASAVKAMFDNIISDIYVLVDGDDTYPTEAVCKLIEPIIKKEADMTIGARLKFAEKGSITFLHYLGNKFLTWVFNLIFRTRLTDVESGYRVFSRNLVDNLAIISEGFGIEPEITARALEKGFKVKEFDIKYRSRPKGSKSKLRTFRDGFVVIGTIFSILKDYKPLHFFFSLGGIFILFGLIFGAIVIKGYIFTGIVSRIPLAIAATSLVILGVLTGITGLVVDTVNRKSQEEFILLKKMIKRLKNGNK
ncbi:MAG: glycosyltransferase family 2 protein [Patescibacteria group bacterium]